MTSRPFSLTLYILIVCAFSWPFQIMYMVLGPSFRPLLLLSMTMVAAATYICGKFVFRDGFAQTGWLWGKPKYYVMAFGLAVFLWGVPVIIEIISGAHSVKESVSPTVLITTFFFSFIITLLPAFGEEFGWRGYMLPRLLERYSTRKALLIHGFVTWFWHFPFIIVMGREMSGNWLLTIPMVFLISLIPTVMHAVVFAYFRSVSGSIAVATVYHSAFDEVRDTLQERVGFGSLVDPWQMITLTVVGIGLLWKTDWIRNRDIKYE